LGGVHDSAGIGERTAIVHDWFQGYHGSERVVETIRAGLFPSSNPPDIFTFHAARELLPPELAGRIVRESRLGRLPGVRQHGHDPGRWRYLLPYMPRYFHRLPLQGYRFVLSSSHACAINVRRGPDAVHLCYCHTPMRYAWLPDTERGRVGGLKGLALRSLGSYLRRIDRDAAARVDGFAANSSAVRDRIQRFYGRDAEVIHPPVDLDDLRADAAVEEGHFLWVHRLVSYKRPELVVEAFRGLPFRLTMVGVGPLEATLRRNLPVNVELLSWIDRKQLAGLYARASGFVHVGEEDFGITMVEALASGTPVVALARGGSRDIVRDGIDGILLEQATLPTLRAAIARVAAESWDRRALAARAEEFSRSRFLERMGDWISSFGVQAAP
jgi:glycosyltransferase involved in cell wall biosynthesis